MTTTTMTSHSTAAFGRLAGVAGTVALRLADFFRAYKNRRGMQLLAGLDDGMLADIGLQRGDIRDALAQPLWHDPTTVLVMRAGERREALPRGKDPRHRRFSARSSASNQIHAGGLDEARAYFVRSMSMGMEFPDNRR